MLIIRTRLFYFAFLKDPAGAALEKAAQTFGSKPTKKIVPGGGLRSRLKNGGSGSAILILSQVTLALNLDCSCYKKNIYHFIF